MGISYFMQKSDAFKNLSEEGLNYFDGEPSILIFFDKFIE